MKCDPLPKDRVTFPDGWDLKCPWCGQYVDDATVRLEDLINAFVDGNLNLAPRDVFGRPPEGAVEIDCLSCARPFVLVLFQGRTGIRHARLRAIRTKADAKLLEEGRNA